MAAGEEDRRATLLACLAAGMTDEAIARELDVSVRTIARDVQRLFAELGVRTRFQAGLVAARRGLLPPPQPSGSIRGHG